GRVPPKIHKGTKERGCIVDSASNVQVLGHKAIGGFLTRGQWDSTLQGLAEGVPIICWPSSWDQQVNSKCVSKAWKVGIDMAEGSLDRSVIEKTIRIVMEPKGELVENATKMIYNVRKSVSKDGSSFAMLDHLELMHS
ncbi:7-deoxyloganetic acid glucosyltransferase-like protein, partial [Tanacetum coccineum]